MMEIKYQVVTDPPRYMAEEWPYSFAIMPRIGELVAATSGFSMRVASIVHSQTARAPDAAMDAFLIIITLEKK